MIYDYKVNECGVNETIHPNLSLQKVRQNESPANRKYTIAGRYE
jgi:hypothetical protein